SNSVATALSIKSSSDSLMPSRPKAVIAWRTRLISASMADFSAGSMRLVSAPSTESLAAASSIIAQRSLVTFLSCFFCSGFGAGMGAPGFSWAWAGSRNASASKATAAWMRIRTVCLPSVRHVAGDGPVHARDVVVDGVFLRLGHAVLAELDDEVAG